MAAVGGDLQEIIIAHPTVGTVTLFPKAGEDSTFNPGGIRNDDDNAGIDGGGRMIVKKSRTRWSLEATISNDMNGTQEMEQLVAIAASNEEANITITHINGAIYKGKGTIVGDINPSGMNATIGIKLAGGGSLAQL